MMLNVILTDAKNGETRGAIVASTCSVGRLVAAAGQGRIPRQFVGQRARWCYLVESHRPRGRRGFCHGEAGPPNAGSTTLKVENRLPFTVTNLVVQSGTSSGAPPVAFEGVGVAQHDRRFCRFRRPPRRSSSGSRSTACNRHAHAPA